MQSIRDDLMSRMDRSHAENAKIIEAIWQWTREHAGQTDNTAHTRLENKVSDIKKKVLDNSDRLSVIRGIGIALTAIGLGNAALWLYRIFSVPVPPGSGQ